MGQRGLKKSADTDQTAQTGDVNADGMAICTDLDQTAAKG